MIDTLKMSRVLERAGLNREGAEEVAEELRDQIDRKYVTRDHFDARMDAQYWKMMAGVTTVVVSTVFAHFVAIWFYVGNKLDAIEALVRVGGSGAAP